MREKLKKVVGNYENTRTQTGHEHSAKNHGGMYMRCRMNVVNGYLVEMKNGKSLATARG